MRQAQVAGPGKALGAAGQQRVDDAASSATSPCTSTARRSLGPQQRAHRLVEVAERGRHAPDAAAPGSSGAAAPAPAAPARRACCRAARAIRRRPPCCSVPSTSRASARDSSSVRLSGVVTSTVGRRRFCALRSAAAGVAAAHADGPASGAERRRAAAASARSVSAASARIGVSHSTVSGGATACCARGAASASAPAIARTPAARRARPRRSCRRRWSHAAGPTAPSRDRLPDLALERERLPAARGEPGRRSAAASWRAVIATRQQRRAASASVSASSTGLSSRQRSMRGKRTAMPLLCRVLRAMPSKPSSNTSVGVTLRTGPKLSTVVLRMHRIDLAPSRRRSGPNRPWRTAPACAPPASGGAVPDGEGVVAVEAGAAAVAALGVDQHGVDAERIDLPLPPGADVLGAARRRSGASRCLSIMPSTPIARAASRWRARSAQSVAVQHRAGDELTGAAASATQLVEQRAALVLRQRAQVAALAIRAGRRPAARRDLAQQLRAERLAADALLQLGEGLHAARRARPRSRRRARCRRAAPRPSRRARESGRSPAPRRATTARPAPARLTSCARMPSHFHSTIQSAGGAEQRVELLERQLNGCARKNG